MPKCKECIYCFNYNPEKINFYEGKVKAKVICKRLGVTGDFYICDIRLELFNYDAWKSNVNPEQESCEDFEN